MEIERNITKFLTNMEKTINVITYSLETRPYISTTFEDEQEMKCMESNGIVIPKMESSTT